MLRRCVIFGLAGPVLSEGSVLILAAAYGPAHGQSLGQLGHQLLRVFGQLMSPTGLILFVLLMIPAALAAAITFRLRESLPVRLAQIGGAYVLMSGFSAAVAAFIFTAGPWMAAGLVLPGLIALWICNFIASGPEVREPPRTAKGSSSRPGVFGRSR